MLLTRSSVEVTHTSCFHFVMRNEKLFFIGPAFSSVSPSTAVCPLRPELAGNCCSSALTAEHKYVDEWWFFCGPVSSFLLHLAKEWSPTYWLHTAVYGHLPAFQIYTPHHKNQGEDIFCLVRLIYQVSACDSVQRFFLYTRWREACSC